ncbi:helix-turn-helix domain-containing protein [Zavarzinia compransoris]|uniref:Transcriptional regulator n=1 Tax=Zavarzinia compransoris TaxID=1264899 RepID=A0A317E0G1_9PROT|nr:helix-turn-helix transcriptional regulator [Zavarzinia compransoris]PWR18843.1 transcriptional regulator [Zavarzinia compransoris]TDP48834.1 transcriptional regulator with XRE-family HTH domain [Zavarzinia compransoris]
MPLTPLDLQIGRRIRERRWLLGLSQDKLARRVGLKFQQIQKYETGGAKVSAGRLSLLAEALDVPISYFYAHAGPDGDGISRDAADLARLFMTLPEEQRSRLLDLVRAISTPPAIAA